LEDHLGDMDFKVCGTEQGVTALQMDIKIAGITAQLMRQALAQAREGRLHILGRMRAALAAPREQMSPFAPRIYTLKIKPEKIREVIGPGGKVIRDIEATCGVKMDVQDDGTVTIASSDEASAQKAITRVNQITEEVEVGKLYMGKVKKIMDFGAFVEVLPGVDGLVHISQLAHHRVKAVSDEVKEGDEVLVKGTRRRSAEAISREIDALGGELNAFTSRECTTFYAKVLDEHLTQGLDLLADIFHHSRFDAREVTKEKQVVLEEIRMVEDDPEDYLHDLH